MQSTLNHKNLIHRLKKNPGEILGGLTAHDTDLMHMALGLGGETGEVIDLVKKSVINGQPIDVAKMKEELGDVMFYLHGLAMALDIHLDVILRYNTAKLNKRYPQGYSDQASAARIDVGEQIIAEEELQQNCLHPDLRWDGFLGNYRCTVCNAEAAATQGDIC